MYEFCVTHKTSKSHKTFLTESCQESIYVVILMKMRPAARPEDFFFITFSRWYVVVFFLQGLGKNCCLNNFFSVGSFVTCQLFGNFLILFDVHIMMATAIYFFSTKTWIYYMLRKLNTTLLWILQNRGILNYARVT